MGASLYGGAAGVATSSKLAFMDALSNPLRAQGHHVADVLGIARRYCELIDASGEGCPQWLREVAVVLPRLQAVMTSLYQRAPNARHDHPVDLDARFELYSHLRGLLAERDGYFLEFDCAQEGADAMTGSLADDLTDIYCELKHGLRAFSAHPDRVLEVWCLGFECHWGQHLVDAQRHLANLAAADRLE